MAEPAPAGDAEEDHHESHHAFGAGPAQDALHELELLHEVQPLPADVLDFTQLCKRWTEDARVFFADSDL